MPQLASRVLTVSDSFTLKLNAQVQELQKSGVDVANLTAGEPDFSVPEVSKQAVRQALDLNRSKYTPVPGIPQLREAIARKTNLQQPSTVSASGEWGAAQVVVSNGGKQALFNSMMAVINPGDQVLFPAPFWISYSEMAKLVGGVPVVITTQFENSFKLSAAELSVALDSSPRARLLILNSPCNPTGSIYSAQEFRDLAAVIARHPRGKDLWVLSDEIYDRVTLGQKPFCSFLQACPELRPQVITVNGMSKAAAMTGWRIGWTVAPSDVTAAISTVQSQSTSGINALAQWASLAALSLQETEFAEQIEKYRARSRLVLEILSKAGKLKVVAPEGAFYVFFGVQGYLKPKESAAQLCESLLREARVALVPGEPFGAPGFVRLSFATDEATLKAGCERLVSFLNSR
ncbi:MAG: pyridoxal phosphate-dependent aminotransferase [Bdellovibrionales bacterium]|nr:pyridoxal phosphate-dependent aminotransferase [Bdellovibrionales bacterium]